MKRFIWIVGRDAAIVIIAVSAIVAVFRDNPEDLRRRDELDREVIKHHYGGPLGERVVEIKMIKPGEFDILRETQDGTGVHFRVTKSGSNWLRPFPDPDDPTPDLRAPR